MITHLPIKKPALAGEPGFSLLARNTAVNGSATTAEFCASTGLLKAAICAGQPSQLSRLAKLTGSCQKELLNNSPHVLDRKFVEFGGNRLLSRSVRKAGLVICPQCWMQDLSTSDANIYMRSAWLPKVFNACALHETALIDLPGKDYTSCYDHLVRARLEPNWLQRLEEYIKPLALSSFEKAAHRNLASRSAMYPWLGRIQVDVLQQWALGVGFLVKRGAGLPTRLANSDQRMLIGIGHDIMLRGEDRLYDELDASVTRHRMRLTDTWLHQWAMQSTSPPERQKFRQLITRIADHQGRQHILNGTRQQAHELCIRNEIEALATQTRRTKNWIRRTLQREGLLPNATTTDDVRLRAQLNRCRTYIRAVVQSLTVAESAQRLDIGVKSFEALVRSGIVRRVKSRSHKKPRFKPADLDGLLRQLESKLTQVQAISGTELCSIAEACFQYHIDTATVTQLLLRNQLPDAVRIAGTSGYAGIHINRQDMRVALRALADEPIAPFELRRRLGLSFASLKELDELGLLPSFSDPATKAPHAPKRVSQTTLNRFLDRYQTVTSAARASGVDEGQVYERIGVQEIEWAPEGKGLPIFYRTDLLD